MSKKGVWGWLYPIKDTFTFLELKKDEYIVGKDAGCNYVIKDSQLDKADYNSLSKKQFRIIRKKDGVYLEDINGTYINDRKVGPGKKLPLYHNARIAIGKMYLRVFVYMEKSQCDTLSSSLPEKISEKYFKSYSLGEGGFGEVSLVFEKTTSKRFAMKTVKKNPSIVKYVLTEARILQTISHPCIIRTQEVVDTLFNLFIVLELMEGGDLYKRIKPTKLLTEADMKLIFFQLTDAIKFLHEHKIVHRDIKPENILLASKRAETLIKVTDFGVSKILNPETKMDTHVGTPFYTAPEILKNTHQVYTKQVDIWSMGILLYFCLSGTLPFSRREDAVNPTIKFPPSSWFGVSSVAVTLITAMLKSNPVHRIEISGILSHAWLKDQSMRRKAHNLMRPGEPYVEEVLVRAPVRVSFQRGGSMRQQPRGVMQFMTPLKRTGSLRVPDVQHGHVLMKPGVSPVAKPLELNFGNIPKSPAFNNDNVVKSPGYNFGSAPKSPAFNIGTAPKSPAFNGSAPKLPAYYNGNPPKSPAYNNAIAPNLLPFKRVEAMSPAVNMGHKARPLPPSPQLNINNAAKQNAVKQTSPYAKNQYSPKYEIAVKPPQVNAARTPLQAQQYKGAPQLAKINFQSSSRQNQDVHVGGVRYEAGQQVKDVVRVFNEKQNVKK